MESYKGTFYTTENPDDEVLGILTISDRSEVRLELLGGLGDLMKSTFIRERAPITILGNLFNGKKVTLLECFRAGSTTVFGKSHSENYKPQLTLIGTHISDRYQLHFNEINADIELLQDWLGVIGSDLKIQFPEQLPPNVIYTYTQPRDIEFNISDNLNGSFFFRQSYPLSEDYKFELIQKSLVNITSKAVKSADDLIIAIRSFRKLISFFIGRKVRLLRCILISYEEIIQIIPKNDTLKPIYEEIEVHYNDLEQYTNAARNAQEYFVNYEDIAVKFSDIVQDWYSHLEDKILPITSILLESLVNRPIFDETEFLTTFQGVEAFHRRCIQKTKELKHEHGIFLKEKLDSVIDEEFKVWLKGRLVFAYEPTAKERLTSLFHDNRELIHLDLDPNIYKAWVKEIVDSRNYLTHYDPTSTKKCVNMQKLYDYTELLKTLLAVLVLQYMGIDKRLLVSVTQFYGNSIQRLIKGTQPK